jgi:NitT/TauT family transport system substrate-binding protein
MKRSTALVLTSSAFASTAILPRGVRAATPIRVGCGPDEDFAEGFYANDMKFFQQAGLDPALTIMTSGSALSAATASGSLDVATTNMGSIIAAHSHGLPLAIVAPEAIYSNTETTAALVVDKNGPIRSAADLVGKTVAVSTLGTLYHTSVRNWIDKNGGNSTQVRYVEMPLSVQLPALQSGRVDALASVEPWLSQAKGQVRVLGDPYGSVASRFYISCWVANTRWAAQNRDTVKTFIDVMKTTAVWANANPKLTAPILAKYFAVELQIVESIPRTQMGIRLQPSLIQPVIELEARYKLIPEAFSARDMFAEAAS